jgi:transcriptional regulator NrdR family protein
VLETRESEASIRRRRECKACRVRFTTYERPQFSRLVVRAPSGRQRNYTRRWLATALLAAAKGLPEEAARLVPQEVETQLRGTGRRVFSTEDVGTVAIRELGRFVAAHATNGIQVPSAGDVTLVLDASMPARRPVPAQLPLPIERG